MSEIMQAIDKIGQGFEQFKKVNDARLDEEAKGNAARAAELSAMLEKIGGDLTEQVKARQILEKRLATLSERQEIIEALNDRPRASVQDRIRSEHKDLLFRWIRSRGTDEGALRDYEELRRKSLEVKDVLIGTNASGGFALPEEILRTVDSMLLKISDIVGVVKNIRVGTSDYKELLSINGAGYAWSSETGSRSGTAAPTLRERLPTWGELYAYPQASNWSLQDLFFDVAQWLVDSLTEAFSLGLSGAIWNANGSSKPTGIINTAPVTTADYTSPMRSAEALQYVPITAHSSPFTTAGFGADDILTLVYTLNRRYRPNAKFAMNTLAQAAARKLKDTTGQYLWQPSLQSGQPDRLLGYEVITFEEMGNPTSVNGFPVAFGDFMAGYILVTRADVELIRDNVTTPGYTKFYVNRRYGGIIKNNDAIKLLKTSLS